MVRYRNIGSIGIRYGVMGSFQTHHGVIGSFPMVSWGHRVKRYASAPLYALLSVCVIFSNSFIIAMSCLTFLSGVSSVHLLKSSFDCMTFLKNLAVIVSQRRAIGGVPAIISVILLLLDLGTPSACFTVLLIALFRVLRFLSAHMGAAYRTFGIKT